MKISSGKLFWKVASLFVLISVLVAIFTFRPDNRGPRFVADIRQSLRQQGFKTDLADFDFSTSPDVRAREAILRATTPANRFTEPFHDYPNLMETVGINSAIVVWELPWLKKQSLSWPDNNNNKLTWEEFRRAINPNQAQINAACAAILSGPICFNLNASAGNTLLLPHLTLLKYLTQTIGDRTVLDLHDGNLNAAWTNLLAATRLVTAWQTEPVEISQLVRFGNTTLVYDVTWQGLQTNGWSDEQLSRLQQEWESVDFLTNLPETAAFKRACEVASCQQDQREFLKFRPPFDEFFKEALLSPSSAWSDLHYRWSQGNYLRHGIYEDESHLLLFYRDREIELRNAVKAVTWMQMRQLPGVTNKIFFRSRYASRAQTIRNLHEISTALQKQGVGLLGRAAESEARRGIIITAIALERFRIKYGSYPNTLADLAPAFLKTVPLDFMDGQPLRYRLTDDGHLLLYSVGLDCVDNGGRMPTHEWETRFPGGSTRFVPQSQADIVWPLPASSEM